MGNNIVGRLTRILHTDKGYKIQKHLQELPSNFQGPLNMGSNINFRPLKVDPSSLTELNHTVYLVRTFGYRLFVTNAMEDIELCIGDIIVTGYGVPCAIEFLLGRQVLVNPNSACRISTETTMEPLPIHGTQLEKLEQLWVHDNYWARINPARLKEPIEIQSNGGVMAGRKG